MFMLIIKYCFTLFLVFNFTITWSFLTFARPDFITETGKLRFYINPFKPIIIIVQDLCWPKLILFLWKLTIFLFKGTCEDVKFKLKMTSYFTCIPSRRNRFGQRSSHRDKL